MFVIEYDGSRYHGWQRQKTEPETVQEKIEDALSSLLGEAVKIQGASRTDAGVHALGQVANFFTRHPIPVTNIVRAVNDKLPDDIAARKAVEVPADFNARFFAVCKTYRYTIDTSSIRRPMAGRFAQHWKHKVNADSIRSAMKVLKGEHDFVAFGSEIEENKNTVRTLSDLKVVDEKPLIHLFVTGTAFLYNMVRAIVGTLLDVGRGRLRVEDVERILLSRDRGNAGPTLPACGLTLMEVVYDDIDTELDDACTC
jgi:tRNA pseudouridine38-40 synthase